jgi:hypothetical protein
MMNENSDRTEIPEDKAADRAAAAVGAPQRNPSMANEVLATMAWSLTALGLGQTQKIRKTA